MKDPKEMSSEEIKNLCEQFLKVYQTFQKEFTTKANSGFNFSIHEICQRTLGFYNSESLELSGEDFFLKALLIGKQAPIVLDIGSNVGEYCQAILEINPSAVIHAYEPHPASFAKLQDRFKNSSVKLHNLGCSSAETDLEIYDYDNYPGSSHASIYKDVLSEIHDAKPVATKIRCTTVDRILETENISAANLLKIDTEGHELDVLMGAKKSIAQGRLNVIQFEFNEMNVYGKTFLRDIILLLKEYELFRLLPDGLMPLGRYHPFVHERFGFQNIVAIRIGCREYVEFKARQLI